MSRTARRLGLGLAVLAGAAGVQAGTRLQKLIVYDAKTGELTRKLRLVPSPGPSPSPALTPVPETDMSPFYDASDTVTVEIENARCDDAFKVEITAHEVAEVKAEVRGLEEAQGLISGVLGAPPSKAGVDDALSLPEVGALSDRLSDAEGAAALRQELLEDLRHLQMALELHRRALDDYERALAELSEPIERVETRIAVLSQLLGDLAATPQRCEQLWPLVQRADELLAELRTARARIAALLDSMPAELVADLDLLTKRARTYQDKLARARQAVGLAQDLLAMTDKPAACEQGQCLPIAAVLARQKRLKEAFSDVVGDDALRQVVLEYQAFREKDRKQLGKVLDDLSAATNSGTLVTQALALEHAARDVSARARDLRDAFADRARNIDSEVAVALDAVNHAYDTHRMTRVVAPAGPWTTNQVLIVKVSGKRPVQRPLAPGATLTGPPAPAGSEPPAEDFVELRSARFDVHKSYRWSIAGAVASSTRKEPTFAVRSVSRRDANGQAVKDDDGNVLTDKQATQVGEERPLDYALLLHYYFQKQDVFPGASQQGLAWGLTGGVSIRSPQDDQYLGIFVQPTDGVQLAGGLNIARRTRLQEGVTADVTALDPDTTEPPTIKERRVGAFFGIALDIRIFKRFFGGGS